MTSAPAQRSLFDAQLPPFQKHSETSRLAAISMLPKEGTKRRQVYDYLCATNGATDEQGMEALGMGGNTYRPRRCELLDQGLIQDSGAKRKTHSGELAVVWVVAPLPQGGK